MASKNTNQIFIIGAARSGTTLLGEILSQHSKLAYVLEPKYIWRYGNPSAPDDVRLARDCTDEIKNYIRSKFNRILNQANKNYLLDKTPSNCFRIDFIKEIFPEAKFIHIIRDGRDVVLSAEKRWTGLPNRSALIRRLVSKEVPIKDLPFYLKAFMRDVIGKFLFPSKGFIWGPQFPNIKNFRKNHSILETCAEQWSQSISYCLKDLNTLPASQVHLIRYENLLDFPEKTIAELMEFLQLEIEQLNSIARNKIITKSGLRTYEDEDKIKSIYPLLLNSLKQLGYA